MQNPITKNINIQINHSNLNITQDILPSNNDMYSIGSETSYLKSIYTTDLYVSDNTIHIGKTAKISSNELGGVNLPSGSKVGGALIGTFDTTKITKDIEKNTIDIEKNTIDIEKNTTYIASNIKSIKINTSNIEINSRDIATNTSNIETNSKDIISYSKDITTNKRDIATNTSNIEINSKDITTNKRDIATNTSNIEINSKDIAINSRDIATNKRDIATNTIDITTLYNTVNGPVLKDIIPFENNLLSIGNSENWYKSIYVNEIFSGKKSIHIGDVEIGVNELGGIDLPTDSKVGGMYIGTQKDFKKDYRSDIVPLTKTVIGENAYPNFMTPEIRELNYDGWYYKKTTDELTNKKISWYFNQDILTQVKDLYQIFFEIKVLSKKNLPFICVYTKPDINTNKMYKSKRTFKILDTDNLLLNRNYCCYAQIQNNVSNPNTYGHNLLQLYNSEINEANSGLFEPTEEVLFISLETDSNTLINEVDEVDEVEFICRSIYIEKKNIIINYLLSNIHVENYKLSQQVNNLYQFFFKQDKDVFPLNSLV